MHEVNETLQVINSSAKVLDNPSDNSSLINEALFGESIYILDRKNGYVYCRLNTDDYEGWIKSGDLGYTPKPTHKITNVRSFLYEEKNFKRKILSYLPFGSKISIKKRYEQWSLIYLSKEDPNKYGFVPNQHIQDIKFKDDDWVTVAESFIDIPYKWGGRDTLGIDCSALVQLSLSNYIKFPRDTNLQKQVNFQKITLEEIDRGCLVFWEGHVGIMLDKYNIIHSNSYHMKVKIESLSEVNLREDTHLKKIICIIKI